MAKLRIVLADDSQFARGLLRSFLEDEPDIEVVGEASNGLEAVNLVRQHNPDLITMDLEMPVMGGLETIEELMATQPLPILVVSSVTNVQNAYEAVLRGALDVVIKPEYNLDAAKEFVAKVRMLAKVKVITHMRPGRASQQAELIDAIAAGAAFGVAPIPVAPPRSGTVTSPLAIPAGSLSGPYQRIFAIACSTGGPQVLARILARLPGDFPYPVLIAQHISDGFAGGMAEWLGSLCSLPVRMATEGALIQPGTIYISPSERHLAVTQGRRLTLIERGPVDVYRPSCDTLLNSVAAVFGAKVVGIILTGMGSDGVQGLARIREQGGLTLGQDEASSVIFGMNRVAIETGAVHRVLAIDAIADEMLRLAQPASLKFSAEGRS